MQFISDLHVYRRRLLETSKINISAVCKSWVIFFSSKLREAILWVTPWGGVTTFRILFSTCARHVLYIWQELDGCYVLLHFWMYLISEGVHVKTTVFELIIYRHFLLLPCFTSFQFEIVSARFGLFRRKGQYCISDNK